MMRKFLSKMLGRGHAARRDQEVRELLSMRGFGVYKRIDENRELLQLLQQEAPDFLEQFPWVVGWIQTNDEFFNALLHTAEIEHPIPIASVSFPRPWPELKLQSLPGRAGQAAGTYPHAWPATDSQQLPSRIR